MKRDYSIGLVLVVVLGVVLVFVIPDRFKKAEFRTQALPPSSYSVYFSPHGGCTDEIIGEINQAKTSVFVQAYMFTSKPIADALVEANKRGAKVSAILDNRANNQVSISLAPELIDGGIIVYFDGKHSIAHNKIIIIDEETVITGSFNFTGAAEKNNAENLLVIKSKDLAKTYLENWENHQQHSLLEKK